MNDENLTRVSIEVALSSDAQAFDTLPEAIEALPFVESVGPITLIPAPAPENEVTILLTPVVAVTVKDGRATETTFDWGDAFQASNTEGLYLHDSAEPQREPTDEEVKAALDAMAALTNKHQPITIQEGENDG